LIPKVLVDTMLLVSSTEAAPTDTLRIGRHNKPEN